MLASFGVHFVFIYLRLSTMHLLKFFPLIFVFLALPSVARQHRKTKSSFASFIFENDVFFKEDDGYSNGVFLSWGYTDRGRLPRRSPAWIKHLIDASYLDAYNRSRRYNVTYNVGNLFQNSNDVSVPELIEADAPYVGMTGWSVKVASYDEQTIDRLSLLLGVVGPISTAKYVQTVVHKFTDARQPEGWDHQIKNEPVFRVQMEKTWRLYDATLLNTELDLLSGVTAGVGNYESKIGVGLGVRWGQSLSESFSSSTVFPIEKFSTLVPNRNGWFLFANASLNYVANDIFIDGNSFEDSHSVELVHLQRGIAAGVMVNIYHWNLTYNVLYYSDQYETETGVSRYGSIVATYHY